MPGCSPSRTRNRGLRIKRLWSVRDPESGRRSYADLLDMPEDRRKRLIAQYAKFMEEQQRVRKAMADYFAGQQFFDFYAVEEPAEPEIDWKHEVAETPKRKATARRPRT